MEYAEFEVEYRKVYEAFLSGRRDLAADFARLHTLAAQIGDEDDREDALLELTGLESSANAPYTPEPPSEIVDKAREVYGEAIRDDGTVSERLTRAEAGMRALEQLSPGANPDEKQALSALEHTLHLHIGALRLMQ